jgi:putative ABC transport system permease protein
MIKIADYLNKVTDVLNKVFIAVTLILGSHYYYWINCNFKRYYGARKSKRVSKFSFKILGFSKKEVILSSLNRIYNNI